MKIKLELPVFSLLLLNMNNSLRVSRPLASFRMTRRKSVVSYIENFLRSIPFAVTYTVMALPS